MAKYRMKPVVIEATQWFKNGDHPQDDVMRPFEDSGLVPDEPREGAVVPHYRRTNIDGEKSCLRCHKIMHDHGWIDMREGGYIVDRKSVV